MLDRCFNCGEEIDDELDKYAVLVGMSGRINFCESCGKIFNIPNWYNRKEVRINMQNTKNLNTLAWFIWKSQEDHWSLEYDKHLDSKIFGFISKDKHLSYKFVPVLHMSSYIYDFKIK